MRTAIATFAALLIAAALPGCQAETPTKAGAEKPTISLTIRSAGAERIFKVEVARTPDEQARGLMFRTALAQDGGMIFPFDPPRPASFWMKDTLIPLDMIFIRSDGSIARIADNTVPESLEPVVSGEPVAAVLEIGGGRASELGIAEGDRVTWPR